MNCSVENCTSTVKARGLCNTHYQAWWWRQPKESRNPKNGRPPKPIVSYWGMHTRLKRLKGHATENICIDCGNQAQDWTWNTSCDDVLYGMAKDGRKNLSPYCLHLEHYDARCTPCHSLLDAGSHRPVEV